MNGIHPGFVGRGFQGTEGVAGDAVRPDNALLFKPVHNVHLLAQLFRPGGGFDTVQQHQIDVVSANFLQESMDDDVRVIGAANYATFEEGRVIGHNNDGKGVVKAIQKVTPIAGKRVAILGAGGAGRAMAVEIARAGAAHFTVITRRESQGSEVADLVHRATGIPTRWLSWKGAIALPAGTQIVLNATHLGAAPELEPVPVDWNSIASDTTVVDVITNPRITPFLQTALGKGCAVVNGVEMLVQLAMQIFEAWTGISPDEVVFQRAVAAALAE